jgi:hypothetical protein
VIHRVLFVIVFVLGLMTSPVRVRAVPFYVFLACFAAVQSLVFVHALPPETPQWVLIVGGVFVGIATMAAVAFARQQADTVEAKAKATVDPSDDAPAAAQAAAWRALADALQRGDVFAAAGAALHVWPQHPSCGPAPVVFPSSPASAPTEPKR